MSPQQIKKVKRQRKKFVRKWHRRIGFTAALFILNLAVTGILLNHFEGLGLHNNYIKSKLILNWYGIEAPKKIGCDPSESSICQLDQLVVHVNQSGDIRKLQNNQAKILYVGTFEENLIIIDSSNISLYTRNQDEIRTIESINLFDEYDYQIKEVYRPAQQPSTFILKVINPFGRESIVSFDLDDFELMDSDYSDTYEEISWNKSTLRAVHNKMLVSDLSDFYREHQVHLLKLIQDLHSGQILTSNGKLLTDLVALMLILLALSGFITWQRRIKRDNQ